MLLNGSLMGGTNELLTLWFLKQPYNFEMTEFDIKPNQQMFLYPCVPHQTCVKDLNDELLLAKDVVRAAKAREISLREELETLSKDLQRSQKSHNKLQNEKETLEDQLDELKKKVQRLSSGLQVRPHVFFTPVHFYHEWLRSRNVWLAVLEQYCHCLGQELLLSVWFNRAFLWR